ncbi:hypothetical protein POM88_046249 [Heracleum sosnowskyi]|uniref:Uncharacterized protein n=1 Tax=Heracleum sosnowskyi TaxID=360622 RepID=A0AAD8H6K7_9APIA|nr:hypothetical protein POM88_046249 [Heracleum sosnowskyi]
MFSGQRLGWMRDLLHEKRVVRLGVFEQRGLHPFALIHPKFITPFLDIAPPWHQVYIYLVKDPIVGDVSKPKLTELVPFAYFSGSSNASPPSAVQGESKGQDNNDVFTIYKIVGESGLSFKTFISLRKSVLGNNDVFTIYKIVGVSGLSFKTFISLRKAILAGSWDFSSSSKLRSRDRVLSKELYRFYGNDRFMP